MISKHEPEDPENRVMARQEHDDADGHESTGHVHQDKGDDVVAPVPVKHQCGGQEHK